MAKNDKFSTGAVVVGIKKDVPYMTSWDVDKDGKFTGKPISPLKDKGIILFKKDARVTLKYDIAGHLVANGYADILNEMMQPVDTKIASK